MSKRTNSPTQSLEDEFCEKSQNSRMAVDALLLLRQWYQKHRASGLSVGACWQRLDDQTGLSACRLQNLVSDGPAGPRAKLTDQDRRIILERLQGTETAHTPGVVMVRQFGAVKLERLSLDAAMALDIRYRAILAKAELASYSGGAPVLSMMSFDFLSMGFTGAMVARLSDQNHIWVGRYHLQSANNLRDVDQTGMAHDNHPFQDLMQAEEWMGRNALMRSTPVAGIFTHEPGCRPAAHDIICVPFADRPGQFANAVFLLGREQKYSIDPSPHMTGAVSEIVNAFTIHPQRERQPSLGIIEPRTDDLPAGQTAVPRNGHGSAAGPSEGGVRIGEPKPSRELNADQLGSITSGERDTKTVSGRKSRRALVKLKRQATATKLFVNIAPSRRVSFGSQIESALTEELSNLPNHKSDQISLCRHPHIGYLISSDGTTTSTADAGRVEA